MVAYTASKDSWQLNCVPGCTVYHCTDYSKTWICQKQNIVLQQQKIEEDEKAKEKIVPKTKLLED